MLRTIAVEVSTIGAVCVVNLLAVWALYPRVPYGVLLVFMVLWSIVGLSLASRVRRWLLPEIS